MSRVVFFCAVLTFAVGSAALAPARVEAAPRDFFGVVYVPPGANSPPRTLAADARSMRSAGVQSMRLDFPWFLVEPAPGQFRWDLLDPVVRRATERGIDVLPVVNATAQWASAQPQLDFTHWAPTDLSLYGDYLRALIARYGPAGSFWVENPDLPRRPIRHWQIYNEPSANYFWATPNYKSSYPALLRVAYQAVHEADPGAKVVIAGLASFQDPRGRRTTSWGDLRAFYRNGLKGNYDVLALHPFSLTLEGVIATIRRNKAVLRRFGDGRKPIWVTEMSWTAPPLSKVPRRKRLGIEVSPRRQRQLMVKAYRHLARDRALGVERAYWFTWSSTYSLGNCAGRAPSFQFVGLVKMRCGGTAVKRNALFRTFARVAG